VKRLRWLLPLLFLGADLAAGVRLSFYEPQCHAPNTDPKNPTQWFAPNCRMQAAWGTRVLSITSNSLGMIDREVREVPPASPRRRVLLLGDSFTMGLGVSWDESFAGILASRLAPGTEILNAGMGGTFPRVHLAKAEKLLRDGVHFGEVWVFPDVSDVFEEADFQPGDEFEYARRTLHGRATLGYYALRERVCRFLRLGCLALRPVERLSWLQRTMYDGTMRSAWISDEALDQAFGERGLAACASDLQRLAGILLEARIPLTLAVYPWPEQVYEADHDSRYIRFWWEWAQGQGVEFVDLTPALTDLGPEESARAYYLPLDIHFSARGHARVAEAVFERMSVPREFPN